MSTWDEVGEALEDLSTIRGGPFDIYKPVVTIEYYEHDECATVRVDRCKGSGGIVVETSAMFVERDGAKTILDALRQAIQKVKP